jgi:NTE family protein
MKQKVALVLSSGGARGLAHVGVIEELEENDFEISSISGSSIGALVGGIYATGNLKAYKEWMSDLDKLDVFKLMDFTISKEGFIKGDRVFSEVKKFLCDCKIENLPIPLSIVATDLRNRKEMVFTKGDLCNAIRCSSAIPTIIQPRRHNNQVYIDGGVLNPVPVNCVKRHPEDILVVVNLNAYKTIVEKIKETPVPTKYSPQIELFIQKWQKYFPRKDENDVKFGFLDLMNVSFDMIQDKLSEQIIKAFNPDILVNISRDSCGTFEYNKAVEMIELGRKSFQEAIKNTIVLNHT